MANSTENLHNHVCIYINRFITYPCVNTSGKIKIMNCELASEENTPLLSLLVGIYGHICIFF